MEKRDQIQSYLSDVVHHVRFKEAHADIKAELKLHFEESMEQIASLGIAKEEAEDEAIRRMGSASEVGQKLNEIHFPKIDWLLVAVVICLFGVGLIGISKTEFIELHLLWSSIGLVVCGLFAFLRPTWLQSFAIPLYVFALAVGILSWFSPLRVAGQNYLQLGLVNVKFIDLTAVIFTLSLAGILSKSGPPKFLNSLMTLAMCLIPIVAFMAIGSVYATFLFVIPAVTMMVSARKSPSFVLGYLFISAFIISGFINSGHFVHPEKLVELTSTDRHTDFILLFLRSIWSPLAALVSAFAFCLLGHCAMKTKEIKSRLGQVTLTGITAFMSVGVLWGLFSNFGFLPMPVTGVNIPFLSYGGSMMVAHFALVGISISVLRRKNLRLVKI